MFFFFKVFSQFHSHFNYHNILGYCLYYSPPAFFHIQATTSMAIDVNSCVHILYKKILSRSGNKISLSEAYSLSQVLSLRISFV